MRILWTSLALLAAAAGCSTDGWVKAEYEISDDVEVFIEHRVEDDMVVPQAFAHPADIDPRALSAILSGLRYWDQGFLGKKTAEPVFQPGEVAALAPRIREALRDVGPDQRVHFTTENSGPGVIFSSQRLTRGVVFVRPEKTLNIAFVGINEDLHPMDYAETGRSSDMREATNIKASTQPLVELPWCRLRIQGSGENPYPLWCLVDLGSDRLAAVTEPPPAEPSPAAGAGEPAPSPAGGEIKAKLALLKELFEDGLITEQEYAQKKADLLEGL